MILRCFAPWTALKVRTDGVTNARCLLTLAVVSFPPYFLQALEQIKEQLQMREWVVRRIMFTLERVIDPNVRIVA